MQESKSTLPRSSAQAYYGSYYDELVQAMELLETSVSDMEQDLLEQIGRDPIEYIKSRIKTPASMEEKITRLRKKGADISGPEDLYDGCGLRFVCTFIDDVYHIRNWLVNRPDIMVIAEKDYIRHPKESGYRSHHLQVRVRIDVGKWVNAEIQLRTLVMDSWAQLEHQLRYKKHLLNANMMAHELKRCADEMASTDLNLMTIRDRIVYEDVKGDPDETLDC